jgi:acyl-CoA reductase-like NAD-dependent aldehyde dehydrogenase
VYVHKSLYKDFLEASVKTAKDYVLGDPKDSKTTLGPLAQVRQIHFLAMQCAEAKTQGARVLVGGASTTVNGQGRFFLPTIVADTNANMSIVAEESFGPVLAVQSVDDDAHAIRLMNDNAFGLTASVWTKDEAHANKIAKDIDTGTVFMNRYYAQHYHILTLP